MVDGHSHATPMQVALGSGAALEETTLGDFGDLLAIAKRGLAANHSVRESIETLELETLHPFASLSSRNAGRNQPKAPCPLRTAFQRDRDKILHSKAFRRLKHKTQVFIAPAGDHYRTRLTHSLEVAQVSRTIARALRLNEDLTEAIALGHDLGHAPFGHLGEAVLQQLAEANGLGGFHHEAQSLRIVTLLEPMNLTQEVLDGIQGQLHTATPATLEAAIVKLADRMTYLHHDVEDAIRAGLMTETDIPEAIRQTLGESRVTRLHAMVLDVVAETRLAFEQGRKTLAMSEPIENALATLRRWMFSNVYLIDTQRAQKEKVERVLTGLFNYYLENPDCIPHSVAVDATSQYQNVLRTLDYVAGMTDRYAVHQFTKHLLPQPYPLPENDFDSLLEGRP